MTALKLSSCLSAHAMTPDPLHVGKKCPSIIPGSSIVDNHDEVYQGMNVTLKLCPPLSVFPGHVYIEVSLTASLHLLAFSTRLKSWSSHSLDYFLPQRRCAMAATGQVTHIRKSWLFSAS